MVLASQALQTQSLSVLGRNDTTSYCSIPQKPRGNLAGSAPWDFTFAHSDLPRTNMPSQQNSVGLLDQAEVQHQTIKVCVLGTNCCDARSERAINTAIWLVDRTVAFKCHLVLLCSGKRSCGKSKVIQALAGNVSGPPCQTLGLQVTTCWWGGAQQGLFEQTCTRSLYEFWEVYSR